MLTVDNRSANDWTGVEIWLNRNHSVRMASIPAGGRVQVPLDAFVAGFGQRFNYRRTQITDLRLKAKLPDGTAGGGCEGVHRGRPRRRLWRQTLMARLKSELEVACPCCQTILVIDTNLGRVVSHKEPDRGNKPELSDAQRILAAEAARREAIFEKSVDSEKNRGDALSKRFDEALRQAKEEPVTKPMRDFDLD